MRIPQPNFETTEKNHIISDLQQLIDQPDAGQAPPCSNCKKIEAAKIDCSYNCDNAAEALSEDPARYPVEKNVVPLVFELTTMRLVQTCWSCEGHANIDGKIMKLPQVSFYSEKPFYAQLLSNYFKKLHCNKKLYYPWEITLSDYGQTWEMTYTIKCDLSRIENPDIKIMQSDLNAMGENLSSNIKVFARELLSNINNMNQYAHK